MDWIVSILSGFSDVIIPFLVVLTILVFIHELGHYWVARRCGVRVDVFSIGFGPEIFGWNDRSGTRWRFSLIPLGGYVKMFGDADPTSMQSVEAADDDEGTGDWADGRVRRLSEAEKAESFHHKRLSQRAWIVAAGPLANFILAIVLLMGLFTLVGQPTTPPVTGSVVEGSAAEAAGFREGDRFLEIDGRPVQRFEEIQRIVEVGLDRPLDVLVARDGQEVLITATPRIVEVEDSLGDIVRTARLGIGASGREFVRHDPFTSTWLAMKETVSLVDTTVQAVSQIITGQRSVDQLGGPVRIAQLSGEAWKISVESVVFFMAVLSINLGLINLFPVPMLDGGHLLFYAIEAVRGRPLGEKAQELGFRIGFALVLTLIVFVTWNDLTRLNVFDF